MFSSASRRSSRNGLMRVLPTKLNLLLSPAARTLLHCLRHVKKQPCEEPNSPLHAQHPLVQLPVKTGLVSTRQRSVVWGVDELVVKCFFTRYERIDFVATFEARSVFF